MLQNKLRRRNKHERSNIVKLKIDGVEVSVPEGTTILKAAKANGIIIPTLCSH